MHDIRNGDCLDVMREMEAGTVDAIVTDPPYGLAFMGAEWDSFGGAGGGRETVEERRRKMNDYLGSNAVVPAFASSHGRRVTRAEMVGFQEGMTPAFAEALRVAKPGAHLLCFGGTRTFHRMACAIEDSGWEIRDTIMWVYGSGFPKSMDVGKKLPEWEGWGTCLKPAWEPIIVARKPLDGTVAHNVMEYGTGAINIDGCRVPTEDNLNGGAYSKNGNRTSLNGDSRTMAGMGMFAPEKTASGEYTQPSGRFPANLVHDGSDDVLELFPESNGQQAPLRGTEPSRTGDNGIYGRYGQRSEFIPRGDGGSAARFFYCAKASKSDRGEGNDHPTVKPTALMQWLVRLVCPVGGLVLDPFCGSGTTGVACLREGMEFVGIERDERYAEIATRRLDEESRKPLQWRLGI